MENRCNLYPIQENPNFNLNPQKEEQLEEAELDCDDIFLCNDRDDLKLAPEK